MTAVRRACLIQILALVLLDCSNGGQGSTGKTGADVTGGSDGSPAGKGGAGGSGGKVDGESAPAPEDIGTIAAVTSTLDSYRPG